MAEPDSFSWPPPEVIRYFERKGIRPTFHWQDVRGQDHACAYTVFRVVKSELPTTFDSSISKTLASRWTFEDRWAGLQAQLAAIG